DIQRLETGKLEGFTPRVITHAGERTRLACTLRRPGRRALWRPRRRIMFVWFSNPWVPSFRRGAGSPSRTGVCTRGACAPRNAVWCAIAHCLRDFADVFGRCPATAAYQIKPTVLGPLL